MSGDASDAPGGEGATVERWAHEELESVFRTVGNETRLEALWAISEAEGQLVSFSEIKDRVSTRDNGNLVYHLDQLDGRFLDHEPREGYALRPPAYYVLRVISTGFLSEELSRPPEPIDEPCPRCGGGLQFAYGDGCRAAVACGDCGRTYERRPVPPAAIRGRSASEAAAVLDACVRADLQQARGGVCPRCRGHTEAATVPARSVGDRLRCYDRTPADGPYLEFECRHCPAAVVFPAAALLYELPEAASFFADHGRRLASIPFWRASAWNADGGATVVDGDGGAAGSDDDAGAAVVDADAGTTGSDGGGTVPGDAGGTTVPDDGHRVEVSVAVDDESLTARFDAELRLRSVGRNREL